MIGLADCNNFFVSCERSINPSLDEVPMVVLSNNDGCVVARSNESKRMGVKMGQPAFEIRELIESGKILAYSGNHLLYREKSIKVHDILRRYAPSTIDYSVDESFLDMTGIPVSALQEIGEEIVRVCWEEERIPITLGFAPTKTLAKVATEIGKKSGMRVVIRSTAGEFEEELRQLPINELWGIGRQLSKRLYMKGVYTIQDFVERPMWWVRSELGVTGERSWQELHGKSCIELSHVSRKLQDSISETRTFARDVEDFEWLRSKIAGFCVHVARRLRDMGGEASEMTVFLRTNRFHTERGYFAPEMTVRFDRPVDDSSEICRAAERCLRQIYTPGLKYKRGGVVLSRITPRRVVGMSLFEEERKVDESVEKSRRLMSAIDKLNIGVKNHLLKLGSQISDEARNDRNQGYSSSFGAPK